MRHPQGNPGLIGALPSKLAQTSVGRHSPGDHERTHVMSLARVGGFGSEHIAYRILERGGDIRDQKLTTVRSQPVYMPGHGTLNARKREIPTMPMTIFGLR